LIRPTSPKISRSPYPLRDPVVRAEGCGKGKTTLRCSISTEVPRLLDMQLAERPHAERGDVVEAALKAFLLDSQAAKVPTLTAEITNLKTSVLAAVNGTPRALESRLTQLEQTMATVVTDLSALRRLMVDAEHHGFN
jgi:hypothetical protein